MSNAPVTNYYKADLAKATRELEQLLAQREELETQIAKQKRKVAALHELAEPDEEAPAVSGLVDGITDACRIVFRAFDKPLLPIEVRDKVQALGLPPQSNLLASIHTTIRRMKQAGEIVEVFPPQPGGSAVAAYQWAGETNLARLKRKSAELAGEKISGKNSAYTSGMRGNEKPKLGYPNPTNTRKK